MRLRARRRSKLRHKREQIFAGVSAGHVVETADHLLRGGGAHEHVERFYTVQKLPDAPQCMARYQGQGFRNFVTGGGGDCAIHAAFGTWVHGEIYCGSPRQLLRESFGATAAIFEANVGDAGLCQRLKENLWFSAYKLCARKELGLPVNLADIREEERLLWRSLKQLDRALAEQCLDAVRREEAWYAAFADKRRDVVKAFAATCTPLLEHTFVRPLLTHLKLLDEYTNSEVLIGNRHYQSRLHVLFADNVDAAFFQQGVMETCGVTAEGLEIVLSRIRAIGNQTSPWRFLHYLILLMLREGLG